MNRSCLSLFLALAVLAGCRTNGSGSSTFAGPEGPVHTRPGWIKSPEAIEGTITSAWGLAISDDERLTYLQSMYSLLGGTLVLNTRSLIDQPNELFAIALDNLSGWMARKLVERQRIQESQSTPYLFDGLGLATADAANCFVDDSKEWCDFQDGVRLDTLTTAGADLTALPKPMRKRLMHNIQDVGEFMLLAIDNSLKMPAENRHAAEFLLDDVLLATLKGQPLNAANEKAAWQKVTYTILMSGGFFLEAPVEGIP